MALLIFCSIDVGGFPFQFAEVLNRGGVETYFICTSRDDGHDSTSFHFGNTRVPWNLSDELQSKFLTPRERTRRLRRIVDTRGITGVFATGVGARHLHDANIPYLYWSYGSDLDACVRPEPPRQLRPSAESARFVARSVYSIPRVFTYRRSIRAAEAVMISPFQYATFQKVIGPKKLFFFPHVIPVEPLETVLERKVRVSKELKKKYDASHLFFSSTRLYWGDGEQHNLADNKGNDIMFRGFAAHRHRENGKGSKLVLIEKGPSVAASKELARQLGVADDIIWLEERPRGALTDLYSGADVCFGQFGTPVLSFATLEPLAFATPTVSFIETGPPKTPFFPELPELCITRDPDVIADFLGEMCSNPAKHEATSLRSYGWISRNCSEAKFVEAIVTAMAGA